MWKHLIEAIISVQTHKMNSSFQDRFVAFLVTELENFCGGSFNWLTHMRFRLPVIGKEKHTIVDFTRKYICLKGVQDRHLIYCAFLSTTGKMLPPHETLLSSIYLHYANIQTLQSKQGPYYSTCNTNIIGNNSCPDELTLILDKKWKMWVKQSLEGWGEAAGNNNRKCYYKEHLSGLRYAFLSDLESLLAMCQAELPMNNWCGQFLKN